MDRGELLQQNPLHNPHKEPLLAPGRGPRATPWPRPVSGLQAPPALRTHPRCGGRRGPSPVSRLLSADTLGRAPGGAGVSAQAWGAPLRGQAALPGLAPAPPPPAAPRRRRGRAPRRRWRQEPMWPQSAQASGCCVPSRPLREAHRNRSSGRRDAQAAQERKARRGNAAHRERGASSRAPQSPGRTVRFR